MGQNFISAIIDAFSRGEAHCGVRGAQRCPKGILRGLLCPFPALFHRPPASDKGSNTTWKSNWLTSLCSAKRQDSSTFFGQFGQSNGPSIWYILSKLRHIWVIWRSGILIPKYNHKREIEIYGPKYQKKGHLGFFPQILYIIDPACSYFLNSGCP